jgi:hypothetical protein
MLINTVTLVKSNNGGIKVWFSNITTKVWIVKFASKLHSRRNTYTRVCFTRTITYRVITKAGI